MFRSQWDGDKHTCKQKMEFERILGVQFNFLYRTFEKCARNSDALGR